jgi:hypothetical protein
MPLESGTYRVEVTFLGMCRMTRAPFLLRAGANLPMDFVLVLCPTDTSWRPYEEEQLGSFGRSGLPALVQYGSRKERGRIEYVGLIQQGRYVRPVMTYDLWTLRANSIIYDRANATIIGEGDVVWQDGAATRNGTYIQIDVGEQLAVAIFR